MVHMNPVVTYLCWISPTIPRASSFWHKHVQVPLLALDILARDMLLGSMLIRRLRKIAPSIIDMFKGIALCYSSIQAAGSMHTRPRIPQLVMSIFPGHHPFFIVFIDYRFCLLFWRHIVSLKGIPKVSPESAWISWEFHVSIRSYVVIPFGTLLMKNPIKICWSFKVYASIVRWTCSICLHYSAISDPKICGSWDAIRPVTRSRDYGRGWICLGSIGFTWFSTLLDLNNKWRFSSVF